METKKEFYSHEEVLNKHIGKEGTDARLEYEMRLDLALIGHKVRELRLAKHYTQKQLGELIGVQAAQICKIENGQNLSIANVSRIFRALEYEVKLVLGSNHLSLATC